MGNHLLSPWPIRLPKDIREAVVAEVKRSGMNRNALILCFIREGLNRLKKEQTQRGSMTDDQMAVAAGYRYRVACYGHRDQLMVRVLHKTERSKDMEVEAARERRDIAYIDVDDLHADYGSAPSDAPD